MWNVLLPIGEDYSEVAIYELIVKDLTIRTAYKGWRLTIVAVHEVSPLK